MSAENNRIADETDIALQLKEGKVMILKGANKEKREKERDWHRGKIREWEMAPLLQETDRRSEAEGGSNYFT